MNMNVYRENLLRQAAQAIDLRVYGGYPFTIAFDGLVTVDHTQWNPLKDSGQALELAVELGLTIEGDADDEGQIEVFDYERSFVCIEPFGQQELNDKFAAARLAIVRAAAKTVGEEP